MAKNRFGLSRDIPADVQRQLRQEAGFGCVICGNAIYQYEHIDPEWKNAKEHDPERMTLLCGSCHDNITRGVWSKERAFEGKRNPKCKQTGGSTLNLDVGTEPLIVELGGIQFINTSTIIEIEGEKLLSIEKPEEPESPPLISAKFFGRLGAHLATITNNSWEGVSNVFDIQTSGGLITIRSRKSKVDLQLEIKHPNRIIIHQINMNYRKCSIIGSSTEGFTVKTPQAGLHLPLGFVKPIEKSPYGLSIVNNDIHFGSDGPLIARCLNFIPPSQGLSVHMGNLELWFAKDHADPPPNVDDDAIIARLTDKHGHWTEYQIDIEEITGN